MKKKIQQKNRQRNFFLPKIDLLIFPNTYEFFLIFLLIFENPVCRKMFEAYLRFVSMDYPETS